MTFVPNGGGEKSYLIDDNLKNTWVARYKRLKKAYEDPMTEICLSF